MNYRLELMWEYSSENNLVTQNMNSNYLNRALLLNILPPIPRCTHISCHVSSMPCPSEPITFEKEYEAYESSNYTIFSYPVTLPPCLVQIFQIFSSNIFNLCAFLEENIFHCHTKQETNLQFCIF
jgi:hypothetical protein